MPSDLDQSSGKRKDPLGFLILHEPHDRTVDIIFIHGLGGTSRGTWCRHRDYDTLWPQKWLPQEEGLSSARILTFGYNASFSSRNEQASLAIGDFASDFLFRMKYGQTGECRLGEVPIVVVAHSMGGLVFKKALIQGYLNDEFRDIVSMIKAIVFLATPHRGTDLAKTLNNILTSSPLGHSPKTYITELTRRSPTIDDLNESFRHHANKLRIFSFYETLTTNVGPISTMILEKDSAVLGYPNETNQPLIANHHSVCKFDTVDDANYRSIVGALRSIVSSCQRPAGLEYGAEDEIKLVKALLGPVASPEEEQAAGNMVRNKATWKHFLHHPDFEQWLTSESRPILWANAPPGTGKTILCSLVIDQLRDAGHICAFFFFSYRNVQKRLLSTMLRSLAYQMAAQIPSMRQALAELAKSGLQVQNADAPAIWQQVYLSTLGSVSFQEEVFWIVDGLDESESSRQAVDLISAACGFRCKIRILAFSRPDFQVCQSMKNVRKAHPVLPFPFEASEKDIRRFVSDEITFLPCSQDFESEMIEEITERSRRNFLWANLVLKQLVTCYRPSQVRDVLEASPIGMDEVYGRMLDSVVNSSIKKDQSLAKIMLSWAMYARTPITIEELFEPYGTKLAPILDLKHTVNHVSGQFVTINSQSQVVLIHHSAHNYLQKSSLQEFDLTSEAANERLLGKCLAALCNRNLRIQLNTLKIPQFLPYAATSWAFHLRSCSVTSDRIIVGLIKFFGGPFVMTWINYLAMSGRLSELLGCSRDLAAYIKKRRNLESGKSDSMSRMHDLDLLESWAIDLRKITTRFGSHLAEDPSLIYRSIPSLSPSESAVSRQFSTATTVSLSISGVPNKVWDDCLARVSGGPGRALRSAVSAMHLAVASDIPKGTITLWDTNLFHELRSFNIGQRVTALTFSNAGTWLACCGATKTYVWNIQDATRELVISNPPHERAIESRFTPEGTLLMVTDRRRVYTLPRISDISNPTSWKQLSPSLFQETFVPDGSWLGTPSCVAFNCDCTHMAVAYPEFPATIWSLDPPRIVSRLRRHPKEGEGSRYSHTRDAKVVWHPSGSSVLVLQGRIIRWNIFDDTHATVKGDTNAVPHDIQCSPNGLSFITGDVDGTVKIYEFESMSLIYQLSSEDRVNRICYSPDSLRFYDLRGSYCNIWEPGCLMRLADAVAEQFDDAQSTTDSFWSDLADTSGPLVSFPAVEARVETSPGILRLAVGSEDQHLMAYAYVDGAIDAYDPETDTHHSIDPPKFGLGVDCMIWDSSHTQLGYSRSGAVIVKRVFLDESSAENDLEVADIYVEKSSQASRGHIRRLIFDSSGERLLIYGTKSCQVLILSNGQVDAEYSPNDTETACWVQHPWEKELLLCLTTRLCCVFTWKLEKRRELSFQPPWSTEGTATTVLHDVIASYCSQILLLRTVTVNLGRPQYGFALFSISALRDDPGPNDEGELQRICLPDSISDRVVHPVGILPDGRLMFLDKKLWVCTAQVRTSGNISQHFFIPHDWVVSEGLRLCHTFRDGTVVLPTKGRVAIFHSDITDW